MKLVSIFFGVMILSLQSLLPAQQIEAQLDFGKRDPHPDYVEYSPSDQGLVTLGPSSKQSSRYINISKYDRDFKLQWTKTAFQQSERKNLDFVAVIGQSIMVFVSEFSPKQKVIKTYFYRYDLAGELLDDAQILSVHPNQKKQKVELQYVLSPNKKKLLCYKNLANRNQSEKVLYYTFDADGQQTSNGEISLKYPDNRFQVSRVRISNQGNVFFLGKFFKVNRVRSPEDFQHIIYRHDVSSEQGAEISINSGTDFITDLNFRLDRKENIYVAGFFSASPHANIKGTLLQKISPAAELLIDKKTEFSETFLAHFLTSGQIRRGKELRNFYLKDIVLRSDGGVLLSAEKFYTTTQSSRDSYGRFVSQTVYHYGDVILTSVDPVGEIEWQSIVDKYQASTEPASLSYFGATGAQGTHIFYEYKPRKLDFNIYYNTVGIDGTISARTPLFQDYKYSHEFYPRFCEQVSNSEALLVYFQHRGKQLSVIRLKMD